MSIQVFPGGIAGALTVLALCIVTGASAAAQQRGGPADCAAIEDDAERLACYDALRPPPAPAPAAAPSPASSAAQRAGQVDRQPADAPGAAATAAQPNRDSATPAQADRAAANEPSGRRESERPVQSIVVTAVTENFTGVSTFTTDDGDVYVQTSTRSPKYPDPPFNARLEPATFGSYFLIPENERNRIRVSLRE